MSQLRKPLLRPAKSNLIRRCLYVTIGETATCSRRFSKEDVAAFADLTGDHNPIHTDDKFASSTGVFDGRVVHGALINGFVSGILGNKLPGPGSVAFSQQMQFPKPLYLEEKVTAEVTIAAIKRKFVECDIICRVPECDKVVLSGKAVVMLL